MRLNPTLILLFFVSLGIRTAAVLNHPASEESIREFDSYNYHAYAVNLIGSGEYRNHVDHRATRMPGYPLFLAAIYKVFGVNFFAVQMVQAVLNSLSVILIFLICAAFLKPPWPLVGGIIAAVYFDFWKGCSYILSEPLFIFLLTIFFFLWIKSFQSRRIIYPLIAGASIGMAALVRPEAALISGLLGLLLLKRPLRSSWLRVLVFWSAAGLFLFGWGIRNHRVLDQWIFSTSTPNFNAWAGLKIPLGRLGMEPMEDYSIALDPNELVNDDLYKAKAKEAYARTSWKQIFKIWAYNTFVLVYPFHPAYDFTLVFCLPFLLMGLWACVKSRDPALLVFPSFFLVSAAIYILFGATVARYREPLSPAVVLMATAGLATMAQKMSPTRFKALLVSWLALNLGVWVFSPQLRQGLLEFKARFWMKPS